MQTELKLIDDDFIRAWHPKYDETECDEPEYKRIANKINPEIQNLHTLTKETFTDILDWKSPRVKGRIEWENIRMYLDALRKCLEASGMEKMKILIALQGIGVPVASTFLHFLYPSSFPIIDRRTVDVLRYFGYIRHKSIDIKRYPSFWQAILSIREYSQYSLREIDRAIFAYHKQNPELFGKLSKPRKQ